MKETNLDFDTVVSRRHTDSLKFDFVKKRGFPENVLPLWVADMDFKTSSCIQAALEEKVAHGIYGYTETDEEYYDIVKRWMKQHYDWDLEDIGWLVKTPGVVFAIAAAIQAFSKPGDSVLILQPVYYLFSETVEENKRRLVSSTLVDDGSGRYKIDFEDFEKKIIEENVKIFLLSNPHNPGGMSWTKEELIRLGDICLKHNVIVVSDEIHADFVWEGNHNVFVKLKEEYKDITITCTSPSKTFNLAGLQISNILIPDRNLQTAFKKKLDAFGYSQANTFGIIACEAAYKNGGQWLESVKKYIRSNIEYTKAFIEKNLTGVKMFVPEATYLVWLDFRGTGLNDDEINRRIIYDAGVLLDNGSIFGESGKGFQRINVACPRSVLSEALERIKKYF